jgi:hypothetical protein
MFLFIQLARRELNPRPASYKDAALTAELRASSWAGGIRTHTLLIKSQGCSLYTTTQYWLWCIRLLRIDVDITLLLVVRSDSCISRVVALRIELSVTALSGPSGQPVPDYRMWLSAGSV